MKCYNEKVMGCSCKEFLSHNICLLGVADILYVSKVNGQNQQNKPNGINCLLRSGAKIP